MPSTCFSFLETSFVIFRKGKKRHRQVVFFEEKLKFLLLTDCNNPILPLIITGVLNKRLSGINAYPFLQCFYKRLSRFTAPLDLSPTLKPFGINTKCCFQFLFAGSTAAQSTIGKIKIHVLSCSVSLVLQLNQSFNPSISCYSHPQARMFLTGSIFLNRAILCSYSLFLYIKQMTIIR